MHKILDIQDIENADNKTLYFNFNEKIEEIDCVKPIEAKLCARMLDDLIQIEGNVKGSVKLICDVCLEEYQYDFDFELNEMYAKHSLIGDYQESGQEFELKDGQFVTDLNGETEIDIYDLLYQSVILNFPNKKVCGINCKGNDFLSQQEISDPRLDVFKNIQINPKN